MSLQLLKDVIFHQRQDNHVTDYKINRDQKLYDDIRQYDEAEARRLGKR